MSNTITVKEIQSQIKILPNHPPFMLSQDLAGLYETEAKYINRAVERNKERFPKDFCFKRKRPAIHLDKRKKRW